MADQINTLKEAAAKLKTNSKDVPSRIDAVLAETKELQRENDSLAAKLSNIEAGNLVSNVKEVNGIKVLVAKVPDGYEQPTCDG